MPSTRAVLKRRSSAAAGSARTWMPGEILQSAGNVTRSSGTYAAVTPRSRVTRQRRGGGGVGNGVGGGATRAIATSPPEPKPQAESNSSRGSSASSRRRIAIHDNEAEDSGGFLRVRSKYGVTSVAH